AKQLVLALTARHWRLSLAESCTGGLVSAAVTDIAGASAVFTHGFITYANEAKIGVLGVEPALIAEYGAVSPQVAASMAEGALKVAGSDLALAITGIAGPDGGTATKPVGLVWFGLMKKNDREASSFSHLFSGTRTQVRQQATHTALQKLLEATLENASTPDNATDSESN
ncbi:MAG: CinA family protein, partial [Alphaproteobacteria bacterium]